jgi:hypothetical protein
MQSSREDAILLLKSWRESGTLIQFTLEVPGMTVAAWVLVSEVSGPIIRLKGREAVATLDLRKALDGGFAYTEPWAEVKDQEILRDSENKWLSVLAITFTNSTTVILGESPGKVPVE